MAATAAREEAVMVLGSIAGVALLYELMQTAHQHQLAQRLHAPSDVWAAGAAVLFGGLAVAYVAPRFVSWFGLFVMIAGWSSGSVAAYSNQGAYAIPLLGLGLAGAAVAVISFYSDKSLRRPRVT
jgi:hypothetical protein